MQDILNLDETARMNKPGFENGNWKWKMHTDMITDNHVQYLKNLGQIYGRL